MPLTYPLCQLTSRSLLQRSKEHKKLFHTPNPILHILYHQATLISNKRTKPLSICSYLRMPSFMHIVRLSEDYVADSSASPPVTLYKQNLLLQISAKGDWVLVRVLFEASSTPIWIPKRLVTKARPGFYRLRADCEWDSGTSKKKGDVVRVRLAREGK